MKEIAVVGTGYVGLVAAAGLAELGNNVHGVDTDKKKIEMLEAGRIPIYEEGLAECIEKNTRASRLRFSVNVDEAIRKVDAVFVAVGTPPLEDGSADLSALWAVTDVIASNARPRTVVVIKSTVPAGTAALVSKRLEAHGAALPVVSNPEFLREGRALDDFLRPDRVVIGCEDDAARRVMMEVYRTLDMAGRRFVHCSNVTAELCKYANNAFLAMKVGFANQMAELCEALGADIRTITATLGMDRRINGRFLDPGPGFGGSCFPKDLRALAAIGRRVSLRMSLIEEVLYSNYCHMRFVADTLEKRLHGLGGRSVAVLGLAFKADTDDVRESPALEIVSELAARGASVRAFDPMASKNAEAILLDKASFCHDEYHAAEGADALLICTEWGRFLDLDLARLRSSMSGSLMYDTRNLLDADEARAAGFEYLGMGTGLTAGAEKPVPIGSYE